MSALICDTSGLIAYFDASDRRHADVEAAVNTSSGPFVVSPFVLAELDYLLATRRGVQAELAVLGELASGAWELPHLDAVAVAEAATSIDRYQDLAVGLADASLVLLAERYRTDLVLTLDQRHFGVLRTGTGGAFTILPRA